MSNKFQTVNPATEEVLSVYEYLTDGEIESQLIRAWDAYERNRGLSSSARRMVLEALSERLLSHKESVAKMITLEMGKPISEALAEVEKSALALSYLAEHEEIWPAAENIRDERSQYLVEPRPMGPILAIMPWNFPIWQVVRVLAEVVVSGSSLVLKPADAVRASTQLLVDIVDEVGPWIFNLPVPVLKIENVIADSRIRAVTLTGSVRAGREVAALAGRYLKKSVMELGGSDAYVVFADADVKLAAQNAAKSRLINGGQSCISAKRFFIESAVLDSFLDAFCKCLKDVHVGNPLEMKTQLGPLATQSHLALIREQVENAVAEGLETVWSRAHGQNQGFYSDLHVLRGTGFERSFRYEEFFGPVALVSTFDADSEMIQKVNASEFGLGSAIFTRDRKRFLKLAAQLEVGMVAWNDFLRSDVRFPFGGQKNSGYGRELGRDGLREFVASQTLIL